MFDKIEFSCKIWNQDLQIIKKHAERYGELAEMGGKFGYTDSLRNSKIQIFYAVSKDQQTRFDALISIGSQLSNKYGLHIVKNLYISVLCKEIKFTRFDICQDLIAQKAIDFKIEPFKILDKPNSSFPLLKEYRSKIDNSLYESVYFETTNYRIRCYDKGVEQKIATHDTDWKRFEIQIKKAAIKSYMPSRNYTGQQVNLLKSEISSILAHLRDRYKLQTKYQKIITTMSQGEFRSLRIENHRTLKELIWIYQKQYKSVIQTLYLADPDWFDFVFNEAQSKENEILIQLQKKIKTSKQPF